MDAMPRWSSACRSTTTLHGATSRSTRSRTRRACDEISDPFRGRADLASKVVRAVGDPDARMQRGSAARASRDSVCGSIRVHHRAGDTRGNRGERALSRAAVARACEARARQDDGAGTLPEWRARDLARHRRIPFARSRARRVCQGMRSKRRTSFGHAGASHAVQRAAEFALPD